MTSEVTTETFYYIKYYIETSRKNNFIGFLQVRSTRCAGVRFDGITEFLLVECFQVKLPSGHHAVMTGHDRS